MLRLDHIAIACTDLEQGVAEVEARLGVPLQKGGMHAHFGTHNALLGLADGLYLEVIAINPDVVPLQTPRWFDLDRFDGKTRLHNWICAADDMPFALEQIPFDLGDPVSLTRGDLRWQMAVPNTGILPFDNMCPAVIEWAGRAHPAQDLKKQGCSLSSLYVTHPQADALQVGLGMDDPRVQFRTGAVPSLHATIETPNGSRSL
jgi:hypothetical protein